MAENLQGEDIPIVWEHGNIAEYDVRRGVPPRNPVAAMVLKVAEAGRVKIRYVPPDSESHEPVDRWVLAEDIKQVVNDAIIAPEEPPQTPGEARSAAYLDHLKGMQKAQTDLIVDLHLLAEDYSLTRSECLQILVLMMHQQAMLIVIQSPLPMAHGQLIGITPDTASLNPHQLDMLHVKATLELQLDKLRHEYLITPAEAMHMLIFIIHMQTALLLAGEENAKQEAERDGAAIDSTATG